MTEEIKNKEFFKEILKNHYNDPTIKIIDFDFMSSNGKGENYASDISRVDIKWQRNNQDTNEEKKFVIKTLPEAKLAKDLVNEGNLFETEISFYSEILPMYKSIISNRGIEYNSILAPTFFNSNKLSVLILEDMAPLGFRLGDRRNGGDFNHGLILVKALARNQALSIAVNRKIPGYFEDKVSILFKKKTNIFELFFSKPMSEQIETLEQWPEFREYVGRIQPKSAEEIIEIFQAGDLKAICQGDCWMNNMLFRYDEATGKPEEVCLIDYQICFWGPMVYDVIYFMHSSLSPDVLEHKKYILIDEYIAEFHKWMKDLNEEFGEYTRENILKDFKKMQYANVVIVMSILYIISADPKDGMDIEIMDSQEGKSYKDKIRNNPFYKQKLLKLLQLFARENII